jgi:3-oxoacyl-[acyl-carrier protein] reductase
MNSNVRSSFLCSKRVVPVTIGRGRGRIINISSISALASDPRESVYAASKGAIISFTRALAQELGPMNISVNAIAPGTIQTPMTAFLMKDTKLRDAIAMQTPIRRIGRPEDIGEAALFFAKDGTEFTTGNVLCVDGGWMIDSHIPWT